MSRDSLAKKEWRARARDKNTKRLLALAEKAGWDVVELTFYQFRLANASPYGVREIDLYPTSMKIFDLRSKRWSQARSFGDVGAIMSDVESR